MSNFAPPPLQESLFAIDPKDPIFRHAFLLSKIWANYLGTNLVQRVESSAEVLTTTTAAVSSSASIPVTGFPLGSLTGGVFRVGWAARITQAATVSSSLTITITWTESTIVLSTSGAAITGNTVTTIQSGIILFRADQGAPISYSTVYVSVGATPMKYNLDLVLETVGQ